MKFSKKLALLPVIALSSVGATACKSIAKMPVNFVAVTSSSYNAEVQFGTYDYKFQGKISQTNNNFTLNGIAVARHGGSSGGGGGWGGPGGGPGGNSSGPTFEGFGAGQQQGDPGFPGGDPSGDPSGDPGFPSGDPSGDPSGNPGFPSGDPSGDPSGNPGFPGGGDIPQGQLKASAKARLDLTESVYAEETTNGFNPFGPQEETKTLENISVSATKTEYFINEVVSPFKCEPENSEKDVTWTSSNEEVASVSEKGEVTPLSEGTSVIKGVGKTDPSKSASFTITVVKEDLEQYNWSVSGTYVYEKGYGYKITFNDEGKTVIHTDFDKTEGRHGFYYNVKIGETSSMLHFQAKDPTFKDSLAKDYKKWDERDSTYIFYAKATGNNNSVATAYMYLHGSDNSVVLNTPSGADRSVSFGMTWEEKDNKVIIHDGATEYVADKSVNAEHPGYRLIYSGNAYFCSLNPEVKWKKMLTSDFDGENEYELAGTYTTTGPDGGSKEVMLNLGKDGKSRMYVASAAPTFIGTWAKDGDKITVSIEGQDGEFEVVDGKLKIIARFAVSSFFGSSTVEAELVQK